MRDKRIDPVATILLVAIVFYGCLEYRLVLYARYIMDEFLHASWAGDIHFGVWPYAEYMPFKTQFGILLYSMAYKLSDNTEGILLISRHIGFLTAILSLCVLFLLCRALFGGARSGLWAVLWTLACSTFIERSFRIRVDMLAMSLALFGLYQFLVLRSWRRPLVAGVFLGLAFCTTQKAAYFIVAFVISFWLLYRRAASNPIREFLIFTFSGVAVFAAYVVAFGHGGSYLNVVRATFVSDKAWTLALAGHYTGLHEYYWQTFSRNITFYCLSFAGLAYIVWYWRSSTWQQKFVSCFSFVVLVFLVIHREPWPYVFVFVIPLLGCHAGFISDRTYQALCDSPRIIVLPVAILLLIVIIHSVLRHDAHLRLRCFGQLSTVRAAESVLGPEETYFDGIRMIATRKCASRIVLEKQALNNLVESWETQGPPLMDALRASQCKVIVYNYRMTRLPGEFHHFIEDHFVLIDRNVFVSGSEITSSPQEIVLNWPGVYGVGIKGECENIRIDSKPLDAQSGELYLTTGRHRVTFEGDGTFLLIPRAAWKWIEESPTDPRLAPMFARLYSL